MVAGEQSHQYLMYNTKVLSQSQEMKSGPHKARAKLSTLARSCSPLGERCALFEIFLSAPEQDEEGIGHGEKSLVWSMRVRNAEDGAYMERISSYTQDSGGQRRKL